MYYLAHPVNLEDFGNLSVRNHSLDQIMDTLDRCLSVRGTANQDCPNLHVQIENFYEYIFHCGIFFLLIRERERKYSRSFSAVHIPHVYHVTFLFGLFIYIQCETT